LCSSEFHIFWPVIEGVSKFKVYRDKISTSQDRTDRLVPIGHCTLSQALHIYGKSGKEQDIGGQSIGDVSDIWLWVCEWAGLNSTITFL
jgi:hypothetical protein